MGKPAYRARYKRWTADDEEAARRGDFLIFNHRARLTPPVNWDLDAGKSARAHLHKLFFLDVLLQMANRGDSEAFAQALKITFDWLDNNPLPLHSRGELQWANKVVADRVQILAFILRLGIHEEWLPAEHIQHLIESIKQHGVRLLDPAEYAFRGNHGLYQDSGVFALIDLLGTALPEGSEWRETVIARFKKNLASRLTKSGVYLEHSTDYQIAIGNLLTRLEERTSLEDAEIFEMAARLKRAAGWFVSPQGQHSQIGDSHIWTAPAWAQASAEQCRGLSDLADGGYAIVRTDKSHLLVTASFFGIQHKQADDLGFELYEQGLRVIADPGKYRYEKDDPFRQYCLSAWAHNVLIVDGVSWNPKVLQPYGSGIIAVGSGHSWYAVLARNPVLNVKHRRLFVYKPGKLLIILDMVRDKEWHDYTRLLHIGEKIEVTDRNGAMHLAGPDFTGWIRDYGGSRVTTAKGQMEPISGWTFPWDSEKIPLTSLRFDTHDRSANYVTAIGIGSERLVTVQAVGGVWDVHAGDEMFSIRRVGRKLEVLG